MKAIDRLLIASNNLGKVREIEIILKGLVKEFVIPGEMGITDEVVEDGNTFAENAKKKADFYFKKTGLLTLSDDSGLEVDCLNGLPGVRSSRFAGEQAADIDNNKNTSPDTNTAAKAVCEPSNGHILFLSQSISSRSSPCPLNSVCAIIISS